MLPFALNRARCDRCHVRTQSQRCGKYALLKAPLKPGSTLTLQALTRTPPTARLRLLLQQLTAQLGKQAIGDRDSLSEDHERRSAAEHKSQEKRSDRTGNHTLLVL